jgi:hypothetical protein
VAYDTYARPLSAGVVTCVREREANQLVLLIAWIGSPHSTERLVFRKAVQRIKPPGWQRRPAAKIGSITESLSYAQGEW